MPNIRKSRTFTQDSSFEFTHKWADIAVMRIRNLADRLTPESQRGEHIVRLRKFVGDAFDSFATLNKTPEDRFDFDCFSHAISEPVYVFDYADDPASYHAAAKDLIESFVWAMFPRRYWSKISRQDADTFGLADIDRVAKELENVTGHDELKLIKKRLSKLASGLAKEYTRLKSKPPIVTPPTLPAATAYDRRNKWLYKQCCKFIAYSTILRRLSTKKGGEAITSIQGIKQAANSYAKLHNLPPIPRRQSGRKASKKRT